MSHRRKIPPLEKLFINPHHTSLNQEERHHPNEADEEHDEENNHIEPIIIDDDDDDDDDDVELGGIELRNMNALPQHQYKSYTPDIIPQTIGFSSKAHHSLDATVTAFVRSFSVDGAGPATSTTNGGGPNGTAVIANAAGQQSLPIDGHLFTRSQGNMRRWSQTLQRGALRNGKQTIREKTINFMPSRLNVTADDGGEDGDMMDGDFTPVMMRQQTSTSHDETALDSEVNRLTQEIEQHDHLMNVTAQSEQQRMETLRALPKPLAIKREIKAKLSTALTNKSASSPIGAMRRFHYALAMWLNRTEQSTSHTLINMELWYGRLKRIEGNCGSAVGAYFKFLRSLFIMNAVLAVFSLGFIVVPQILFNTQLQPGAAAAPNATQPDDASFEFHFADLFTAQGFMSDSVLFYGAYSHETFNMTQYHFYNMPHAYFLTTTSIYIGTFLVVSIIVARSYRRSFIETAVGVIPNLYANRLFSAWDFSITSHKAGALKHNHIFNELRELLADAQQPAAPAGRWQRFVRVLGDCVGHVLVVALLAAVGYGMWLLLRLIDGEQQRSGASRWSSMYVALAACGVQAALQALFGWLGETERQHATGRRRLHVTLLRCYVLEMLLGAVLLVYWLQRAESHRCWETHIGQEIYRLVVVDFVVFVVGGFAWNAARWMVWRWLWPAVGRPEFDIARGSLGLVFNQLLLWMGMLYAPAMAALVAVKMALTFYVKEASLMYLCAPVTTMWRSAQTMTLFLVMVFVSLLVVITTNGFIITRIRVSAECGPFKEQQYMIDMFLNNVLQLQEDHLFWRLFLLVTKPAVIGCLLVLMASITYYMRAKSRSNSGMVKILKDMLRMEGADKEFLLAEITKLTQGRDALFSMCERKAAASIVELPQSPKEPDEEVH